MSAKKRAHSDLDTTEPNAKRYKNVELLIPEEEEIVVTRTLARLDLGSIKTTEAFASPPSSPEHNSPRMMDWDDELEDWNPAPMNWPNEASKLIERVEDGNCKIKFASFVVPILVDTKLSRTEWEQLLCNENHGFDIVWVDDRMMIVELKGRTHETAIGSFGQDICRTKYLGFAPLLGGPAEFTAEGSPDTEITYNGQMHIYNPDNTISLLGNIGRLVMMLEVGLSHNDADLRDTQPPSPPVPVPVAGVALPAVPLDQAPALFPGVIQRRGRLIWQYVWNFPLAEIRDRIGRTYMSCVQSGTINA